MPPAFLGSRGWTRPPSARWVAKKGPAENPVPGPFLQEYAAEGVDTASLDPPNNKPTLDLIGANMGVFQLLSDQAKCAE